MIYNSISFCVREGGSSKRKIFRFCIFNAATRTDAVTYDASMRLRENVHQYILIFSLWRFVSSMPMTGIYIVCLSKLTAFWANKHTMVANHNLIMSSKSPVFEYYINCYIYETYRYKAMRNNCFSLILV